MRRQALDDRCDGSCALDGARHRSRRSAATLDRPYLADEDRVVTIDGREEAPDDPNFDEDVFLEDGVPIPFSPERITSGLAVGVPGTFATWVRTLEDYGTISLAQAMQPGRVVAQRGFIVDETFVAQTLAQQGRFSAFTSTSELFLPGGEPHPWAPGSRSSMSPTIVLDDGEPFLAVGTPGGSTIITTVVEVLVNRIDAGLSLPEAIAAPRATRRNTPRWGPSPTSEPRWAPAWRPEVRGQLVPPPPPRPPSQL